MRFTGVCLVVWLAWVLPVAAAQPSAAMLEKLSSLHQKIEATQKTKAGTYAKDIIEKAKDSLLRGQIAAEAGNEQLAGQSLDIAELQLELAAVTAEERESAESAAIKRSELKTLETRIDSYLRGKEQ